MKKDRPGFCKMRVGPTEPFEDGDWEDLEIALFDGHYLEGTKQLAAEYEQSTGKKITILKEY